MTAVSLIYPFDSTATVEENIDRIINQYRESPLLLGHIRSYLMMISEPIRLVSDMPTKFDIDTATGDQLTIIGKRLGFPRCHCVCIGTPVFGFTCDGFESDFPIAGFCEPGTWINCGAFGIGTVCISDDETYRGFLSARRYQMLGLFDIDSLTDALQSIWGDTAQVLHAGNGRIVMAPGRELTDPEKALLKLVPRVLPVALGIKQRFHFDRLPVIGFGEGWGETCETWFPDGAPMTKFNGEEMTLADGTPMFTMALTRAAPIMCEFDVKPYDC